MIFTIKGVEYMTLAESRKHLFAEKVEAFREKNKTVKLGQTVFAGSSLMEQFPIEKFVEEDGLSVTVHNRGIGGYITDDLLYTLDECILALKPARLFINIGTNDLSMDKPISDMTDNYTEIIKRVTEALPDIEIIFMAYYPGNPEVASERMKQVLAIRTNEKIRLANMEVEKLARKLGFKFINVNAGITDEKGNLKAEYTTEGMHITEDGYRQVYEELRQYI